MSMPSRSASALPAAAVMVVVGLVIAGVAVVLSGEATKQVTAYFEETSGLYVGNDVRVLGVAVGTVTAIEPEGTRVRVEMSYDADRKIPADARAVIIQPTLLTGRYVQLAPVYQGGPVLPDGAVIRMPRTASPVGFDRTMEALNELAAALGPNGVNENGALSRFLEVTANTLSDQGDDLNRAVRELSQATQTIAESRKDLFGTVRQLQEFTTALARADQRVEAFNMTLAEVSAQLAEDRQELAAALENLALALDVVERFVRVNRDELAANVTGLAEVTRSVLQKKQALAEVLETGGLGLANLVLAYGPEVGALRVRFNANYQISQPVMYICSLAFSLGLPPEKCQPLLAPLRKFRMKHLPFGSDPSNQPLIGEAAGEPDAPGQRPELPAGGLAGLLPGGDR